jgi:antitoxin (DNA-binding transcriptional repressor) of toxin-antitoxin stability system
MRITSIAQLQATLRACLTWVKAGEEVVVTEHDTPIAKIVPGAGLLAVLPTSLAALARGWAMKFWDASAMIPLCLTEPWRPFLMQSLAEDGGMIVWWGSVVEC